MMCLEAFILHLDLANASKVDNSKESLKSDEFQKQYELVRVGRYVELSKTCVLPRQLVLQYSYLKTFGSFLLFSSMKYFLWQVAGYDTPCC